MSPNGLERVRFGPKEVAPFESGMATKSLVLR
jgi:hypothetical protein